MSFKREGNDLSLLANLQRQRVTELLATHIPEDEAILLKNGRYSCVVCAHRPIFDTLDVLAIHRRGKKHLTNLSTFLTKRELKKESIEKRKRETGHTIVTNPKNTSSSLLKASPYNSCCKRRQKPTDRKLILDIKSSNTAASNPHETSPNRTQKKKLGESVIRYYIKHMKNQESFESRVQRTRQLASSFSSASYSTSTSSSSREDEANVQKTTDVEATDVRPPLDEEQIKKANYYLNLRRDGWKKTLDGKWIKDDDAEFNSDEETPPAYNT